MSTVRCAKCLDVWHMGREVVFTPPGFWHSIFGAKLRQRRGTYEVYRLHPHMMSTSGDVSSWGSSWGEIEAAERQLGRDGGS